MAFHHHHHHQQQQTPPEMAFHSFASDQPPLSGAPTWLNNAAFRQQNSFLHDARNDDVVISPSGKSSNCSGRNRREISGYDGEEEEEDELECESARFKADLVGHPLYEQLVSAHVSCLRIATPVDQLPRIDEQLVQSQRVVDKYSALRANGDVQVMDEKELDLFMVSLFKLNLFQHLIFHFL